MAVPGPSATAARVVREEAAALLALAEAIPPGFADAVQLMRQASGRVIVTGMGKSGHVGRKIAATLASTGTPAQFVHAAEASHGDLGMITAQDVVLAISYSGETAELVDIIAHAARFGIPLIALTGQAGASLARECDVALVLPELSEVCPMGLAPTTSTTLTMVLGDALAVALMQEHAFSPAHYHAFHPGGTLGARLLRVSDLMHGVGAMPLVLPQAPMSEVLLTMSEMGFGVAGVCDQGRLIGVITDGDLRRHMQGLLTRNAVDVMTPDPRTIAPDALAQEAVARMAGQITSLFVTDADGQAVGLVRLHDCLRAGVA